MFLDTCNVYFSHEAQDTVVRMVEDHAAQNSVIGVTVVAQGKHIKGAAEQTAEDCAHELAGRLTRTVELVDAIDYKTRAPMAFWIWHVK
jgi:hypothetical protein